jgi:MSHA biogenesis protein MshO
MRLPVPALRSNACHACRIAGVTLIELVVVITISAIIATVLGVVIMRPIQGYQAQVRRGELVDAAEMALRQISRDIHRALPNSVRVDGTGHVIEMLNTIDGARYRAGPGQLAGPPAGHNHGPPNFWLSFNGADTDGFNIVGSFQNIPLPLPFNSNAERLAIYNQGVTGADAYADAILPNGPYVITNPQYTKFQINDDGGGDENNLVPKAGSSGSVLNFSFHWASPNQRVYIVDKPITYLCSPGPGGNIKRYEAYAITASQPTDPSLTPLSGVTGVLLTTPVTACTFTYSAGTDQRAGLVTLNITAGDVASGESVQLLYQVHVDNSP